MEAAPDQQDAPPVKICAVSNTKNMAPHINSKRIHTFKTTMGMGAMEVTFLAVFYLRSNTTTNLLLNCQVSFIKLVLFSFPTCAMSQSTHRDTLASHFSNFSKSQRIVGRARSRGMEGDGAQRELTPCAEITLFVTLTGPPPPPHPLRVTPLLQGPLLGQALLRFQCVRPSPWWSS